MTGDTITVWGPLRVEMTNDPYYGDHHAANWQDALERVETYIKHLED